MTIKNVLIRLPNTDIDVTAHRVQLELKFPSDPQDGDIFELDGVQYRAQVRPQPDKTISIDWIAAPLKTSRPSRRSAKAKTQTEQTRA